MSKKDNRTEKFIKRQRKYVMMNEDDTNRILKRAIEYGQKKYTRKAMGPYYEGFDYKDDPFDIPRVFIASSQKQTIEEIAKYCGGSRNRLNLNIAVIGPRLIGKTVIMGRIHSIAENSGCNGRIVTGEQLLKRFEFEVDDEIIHKTFFQKFLDEITSKTDYIIIDQTNRLRDQISFFIEEMRRQTEFALLAVALFDVVTWNLLHFSSRKIFDKIFYLCPMTEEESKSLLLTYLDKPDQKNPFTEEAVNTIVRSCYGSPGLLIYLARKSMQTAHLTQNDSVTQEVVMEVLSENLFKEPQVLYDAFEASSRRKVIQLMLAHEQPLTATQMEGKMKLTRQTICYHLGKMLEEGVVSKMPKKKRDVSYQITLPSRIAFEHLMLKRCQNEWKEQ